MTVSSSAAVREITVAPEARTGLDPWVRAELPVPPQYLNTRLLPRAVHPPMWRRAALGGMALFYGFFVILSLRSFW
jgi:hypothetical protein